MVLTCRVVLSDRWRTLVSALSLALLLVLAAHPANPATALVEPQPDARASRGWSLPLEGARVTRYFDLRNGEYQAGHRGIDFAAHAGQQVFAPVSATVSFVGVIVDRPVLTLQTDTGVLVSFEPLSSQLAVGDTVTAGELLGEVAGPSARADADELGSAAPAVASHCLLDCLHLGIRVNERYLNPLHFFTQLRPRLLPLNVAHTRSAG